MHDNRLSDSMVQGFFMDVPLAEQIRPKRLQEILGQDHLLGKEGAITRAIARQRLPSMILYGPPGCGKTTLAKLLAHSFSFKMEEFSAVLGGMGEIKTLMKSIEKMPLFNEKIVLFVDEIHRFNKAQQDAFLPFIESGKMILIGATTENPSFYLNNALLSRVQVFPLKALGEKDLKALLTHYEETRGPLPLQSSGKDKLVLLAQGDARYLWNMVDLLPKEGELIDDAKLETIIQKRAPLYDKHHDLHHQCISALHKSVRSSDPDAALYWFCRMLEGGEEPLYLARRLIRMATEDIGLADPGALTLAISAKDAFQMLGSPEGELALAQVVIYLALAPKSHSVDQAFKKATLYAKQSSHLPPPAIFINGATALMKELGAGKGYCYDHDLEEGCSGQNGFPDDLQRQAFYRPVERGFEREMLKRLKYFKKFREGTALDELS